MRTLLCILTLLYSIALAAQQRITLLFAGDLMQHKEQLNAARTPEGTYDYTPCFSLLEEQISRADLAIANLEVPFGGKPYSGYPAFCAPDDYLYAIRQAGFDILLTANNHALDRGRKGLERTLALLDSLHLRHLGTYRTRDERNLHYPLFVTKSGFRLAFLNYTYGTNGIGVRAPNIVNYIDEAAIRQDIRTAQAWRPDAIIACMHWGNEYQSLPSPEQRRWADRLLEWGVTHVIGAHPHVVQPMELRTDSLSGERHVVAYSLGNFLSNMSRTHTDGGVLLTLTLCKDTLAHARTRVAECTYSLVWTGRPALTGAKNYVLYPADSLAIESLPAAARQRMNRYLAGTRRLLGQHNLGIAEVRE
ncbi:MAG: CapA family protein [Prevotellaceae bacterium]|jgi:poly-gamma-glutamate synthesis protein (capsule biosynthesis protein)|nr:CapA family protein [Prevotellaceae bacterium]